MQAGDAQVAASEAIVADLRNELDELKKNDNLAIRANAEGVVAKDACIAKLEIELGAKRADIDRLKAELEAKSTALASANRWLNEKDKALRECSGHISELNANLLKVNNAKSKSEAEMKAAMEKIDALDEDLKNTQDREMEATLAHETLCERLQRERDMFEAQKAAFRESLAVAGTDLEDVQLQASQAQERCESLSAQLTALRGAGKSPSAAAEVSRKLAVAEAKLVQAEAMIGAKEREIEDLHARCSAAESREVELQKSLDAQEERAAIDFGTHVGDKSAVNAELINVKAEAEMATNELLDARRVVEDLSSDYKKLNATRKICRSLRMSTWRSRGGCKRGIYIRETLGSRDAR